MAIQSAEAQTSALAKLVPPHTAAHKLGHQTAELPHGYVAWALTTLFLRSSGDFNTDPAFRTGVLVRRLRLVRRRVAVRVDACRACVRYWDAWTLSASLTRSSSFRKCSKRRILGHSAQATSLPRIEGMTKCSRTALGFEFGSGTEFVADLTLPYSD